jgi:uncharacterized protein DUF551
MAANKAGMTTREEFETFIQTTFNKNVVQFSLEVGTDREYIYSDTRDLHGVWQASRTKALEEAAAWIPVSERLPNENERVLIQFKEFIPKRGEFYVVRFGEISLGHWRPEGGNGNFDSYVRAWMPLPRVPDLALRSNLPLGHPERMKQPGTTRHLKLDETAPVESATAGESRETGCKQMLEALRELRTDILCRTTTREMTNVELLAVRKLEALLSGTGDFIDRNGLLTHYCGFHLTIDEFKAKHCPRCHK